jgi:hypothetical protein
MCLAASRTPENSNGVWPECASVAAENNIDTTTNNDFFILKTPIVL